MQGITTRRWAKKSAGLLCYFMEFSIATKYIERSVETRQEVWYNNVVEERLLC